MRTDRRLTYEDRCQLCALRKAGKAQAEIGQALRICRGTVIRNSYDCSLL
jgi:IS30 family transposase